MLTPQMLKYDLDSKRQWTAVDSAICVLLDFFNLKNVWPAEEILQSHGADCSIKTLKRAKKKLGIRSYQVRLPSGQRMWFWSTLEPEQWQELIASLRQSSKEEAIQAPAASTTDSLTGADASPHGDPDPLTP